MAFVSFVCTYLFMHYTSATIACLSPMYKNMHMLLYAIQLLYNYIFILV